MIRKDDAKESKVEAAKRNSRYLRGNVEEALKEDTSHFAADDTQALKFHGIYQQDDRDVRQDRRKAGLEEAYSFMVRCAIPAGVVTADQYLALDELADKYGHGSLRVTTRQGFQLHGVIKKDLKAAIAGINRTLLTTLSACGDVGRNVMACPAPLEDDAHRTFREVARQVAIQLRPASGAYHEIWLDGEKHLSTQPEEPFYGEQYLPRKFKTGIALAGDNCIDLYSYDFGLIALVEGDRLIGFNIVVGGGMGMTHNKPDTFARLAEPLGFIDPAHAVEAAKTTCGIFRDFGNRADRRHARLKYLLAERGIEWFRDEFQKRASFTLHPWRDIPEPCADDHLGRHRQGGGRMFYGIYIENGRILDNDAVKIRTALRKIVAEHRPGVVLTAHQNLLLTDLTNEAVDRIEETLIEHGVTPATELSGARRHSMACPALPTCGLAMAESERFMPSVVARFEKVLEEMGLRDAPLTMRMTGCPNGCARPYTADIAFVGRRPDCYHVYVGGRMAGDRVADLYAPDVHDDDLVATLRPLLQSWAECRQAEESLGDYYQRVLARTSPRQSITGKEEATQALVQLKLAGNGKDVERS